MTLSYSQLRWLLLGLCGLLFAALAFAVLAPLPQWNPPPDSRKARSSPVLATYPFMAPSSDAFAAIDARPIFSPLRAPLQVSHDASSGSGAVAVGDLSLIGIILDHGTRMALLRTPDKPMAVAVRAGGAIDEWEIVSIDSDRVVLRANGSEQELLLSANKAPPTQPATPVVPPGQPR